MSVQVVNRAARGGRAGSAPPPAVHMDAHAPELPANAVVADLGEGLEVLHLFTGRPVCALTLPAPGLHADVNGDGVLDHVYVRPPALAPAGRSKGARVYKYLETGRALCTGSASVLDVSVKRGVAVLARSIQWLLGLATSNTLWLPLGSHAQLKVMTLLCCVQL